MPDILSDAEIATIADNAPYLGISQADCLRIIASHAALRDALTATAAALASIREHGRSGLDDFSEPYYGTVVNMVEAAEDALALPAVRTLTDESAPARE